MKNLIYITLLITLTSSCVIKEKESINEFYLQNSTNHLIDLFFYKTTVDTVFHKVEIQPYENKLIEIYSSKGKIGSSPSLFSYYDSIYVSFDSIKYLSYYKYDTIYNRNIFLISEQNYKVEKINQNKKGYGVRYTYTFKEEDYNNATPIP